MKLVENGEKFELRGLRGGSIEWCVVCIGFPSIKWNLINRKPLLVVVLSMISRESLLRYSVIKQLLTL